MLIVNHEECTDNVISYQFHVQSRLGTVYTDAVSFATASVSMTEISYMHVWLQVFRKGHLFLKRYEIRKILYYLFKK